jgi:hypothetical protein
MHQQGQKHGIRHGGGAHTQKERKTIGEMISELARRARATAQEPPSVKEPKADEFVLTWRKF